MVPPYPKPDKREATHALDAESEAAATTCEICGRPPKLGGRALHRDHDHKTGRQRGLLCFTCNRFILGKYATAEKLYRAALYLWKYAATEPDYDAIARKYGQAAADEIRRHREEEA